MSGNADTAGDDRRHLVSDEPADPAADAPGHRVRVWLVWFVILNVLWTALVATFDPAEALLGVLASAIAATAAEAVRAQRIVHVRIKAQALRGAAGIPWATVKETWMIFAALLRQLTGGPRVSGTFVCERFDACGDNPEDEARRALYKIGASVAPNTLVVGFDEETGSMLLHRLVPPR